MKAETKVVHIKDDYDVYIGRPSIFGNKFIIGKDGGRDQVIEKFEEYFYRRISEDREFESAVWDLRGKRLGCYCKPNKCHGDVLVEWIEDRQKYEEEMSNLL